MSNGGKKSEDGTVGKALGVLSQVADFERPVRFGELLSQSDHPKATLYRIMQTLTNQGFLIYEAETQTYTLGLRLVQLAHSAWKHSSLAPLARPHLRALGARVGEAIHLAQMDQGQVLFIDKYKINDQFDTLAQTGKVAPGYCTGVGKAILAFLTPERRARALKQQAFMAYTPATLADVASLEAELESISSSGIAFDREEHESGIISIAAPILNARGRVMGALSIATTTTRHSLEDLEGFRAPLIETAAQIGAAAESWQYPT